MRQTWTASLLRAALVAMGASACTPEADKSVAGEGGSPGSGGMQSDTGDDDSDEPPCVEQAEEALSWEEATAGVSRFAYQGVAEPRALVLMFHGGGGDMEDYFLRVDPARITGEALRRGMAVASLDSVAHLDPDAGNDLQWHEGEPGSNPDLEEALEMVRQLRSPTELDLVPADTPIVLIGTSNGGSMASRVAQLPELEVAAAAIYISNAQAFHESDARRPPMVLVPGAQDSGLALSTNSELVAAIDDSAQALLVVNEPEPVTDRLLTRVAGIDCALAAEIVDRLGATGWLEDGLQGADPSVDRSWADSLPEEAMSARSDLQEVLTEAYAGHAPSSDQNDAVFAFVESHL